MSLAVRTPHERPDTIGFWTPQAEISRTLEGTPSRAVARLRPKLPVLHLALAILRNILDAVTGQRSPLGFNLRAIIYRAMRLAF